MKTGIVLLVMLAICNIAGAVTELEPVALHDTLGTVIDSLENESWHIIGSVPGFVSAVFYKESPYQYDLHIVRKDEGQLQLIIVYISADHLTELRYQLKKRIRGDKRDEPFLYQLNERYITSINYYNFVLSDNSSINGSLAGVRRDTLVIQTISKVEISVPDSKVVNAQLLTDENQINPQYRRDPSLSRMFFLPTGIGLNKGRFTVTNHELVLLTAGYGITDHISLYAGRSILFAGGENSYYHVMPKLSMPLGTAINIGTGLMYFKGDHDDANTIGFGVLTIGDEKTNFSAGIGARLDKGNDNGPAFMLSSGFKIGRYAKLIGEIWILDSDDLDDFYLYGIRVFGDNMAVDLGIISINSSTSELEHIPLLWLGFNIFWGGK